MRMPKRKPRIDHADDNTFGVLQRDHVSPPLRTILFAASVVDKCAKKSKQDSRAQETKSVDLLCARLSRRQNTYCVQTTVEGDGAKLRLRFRRPSWPGSSGMDSRIQWGVIDVGMSRGLWSGS